MRHAKLRQEEVFPRRAREKWQKPMPPPHGLPKIRQKAKVTGMRQVTRSVGMHRYLRRYP